MHTIASTRTTEEIDSEIELLKRKYGLLANSPNSPAQDPPPIQARPSGLEDGLRPSLPSHTDTSMAASTSIPSYHGDTYGQGDLSSIPSRLGDPGLYHSRGLSFSSSVPPRGRTAYSPYSSGSYGKSSFSTTDSTPSYLSPASSSAYIPPSSALTASSYLSSRETALHPSPSTINRTYSDTIRRERLVPDYSTRGRYQSSLGSARGHLGDIQDSRGTSQLPSANRISLYNRQRTDQVNGHQALSWSLSPVSSAAFSSTMGGSSTIGRSFEYSRPIDAAEIRRRLERDREIRQRSQKF